MGEEVAQVEWATVGDDHSVQVGSDSGAGVPDAGEGHLLGGRCYKVPPGLLELAGGGVLGMVPDVEDHKGICRQLVGSGSGSCVVLGPGDGFLEQRKELVLLVSSDDQALVELLGSVVSVGFICAQCLDSEQGAKYYTREEPGGVSRGWGDVQVKVEGLLVQSGGECHVGLQGDC